MKVRSGAKPLGFKNSLAFSERRPADRRTRTQKYCPGRTSSRTYRYIYSLSNQLERGQVERTRGSCKVYVIVYGGCQGRSVCNVQGVQGGSVVGILLLGRAR